MLFKCLLILFLLKNIKNSGINFHSCERNAEKVFFPLGGNNRVKIMFSKGGKNNQTVNTGQSCLKMKQTFSIKNCKNCGQI